MTENEERDREWHATKAPGQTQSWDVVLHGRRLNSATRHPFQYFFWGVIMRSWEGWKPLLVSGFMRDGECQAQASVFIDGAASVLAAHPADWSETCKTSETIFSRQSWIILSAITQSVQTQTAINWRSCILLSVFTHTDSNVVFF